MFNVQLCFLNSKGGLDKNNVLIVTDICPARMRMGTATVSRTIGTRNSTDSHQRQFVVGVSYLCMSSPQFAHTHTCSGDDRNLSLYPRGVAAGSMIRIVHLQCLSVKSISILALL